MLIIGLGQKTEFWCVRVLMCVCVCMCVWVSAKNKFELITSKIDIVLLRFSSGIYADHNVSREFPCDKGRRNRRVNSERKENNEKNKAPPPKKNKQTKNKICRHVEK